MAWMETADLWVRPSQEADLELFYQWERRPEVTQFFSIADGQSRAEVEAVYRRDAADPGRRQYTILLKPEGRPIGRIVLADRIEGWKVEIFRIYIADTALRGKGYGKQAMQAILKQCFEAWGMERVYLDHYTGNPAAVLYRSLGFQYEGVLRRNCRKNGKLYDVHLMSMLREEYQQALQNR